MLWSSAFPTSAGARRSRPWFSPVPARRRQLEVLNDHCRTQVARYKVPRALHLVERIQRQPSGKPDYPWAKRVATEALG